MPLYIAVECLFHLFYIRHYPRFVIVRLKGTIKSEVREKTFIRVRLNPVIFISLRSLFTNKYPCAAISFNFYIFHYRAYVRFALFIFNNAACIVIINCNGPELIRWSVFGHNNFIIVLAIQPIALIINVCT